MVSVAAEPFAGGDQEQRDRWCRHADAGGENRPVLRRPRSTLYRHRQSAAGGAGITGQAVGPYYAPCRQHGNGEVVLPA